jgi:hypothetical protein
MNHLTESERQGAADGTLEARRAAEISSHLDVCAECAADVARLRSLIARAREAGSSQESAADEWPAIRARIELGKVVALPSAASAQRPWRWIAAGVAAAVLIMLTFAIGRRPLGDPGPNDAPPDSVAFTAAADSANAYREQIADLMSDLELRRGLLRTETSAAIDRDLKECDVAIAELDSAIKADPNNPALRQMLAASYRRKLDVLKRVGNAS